MVKNEMFSDCPDSYISLPRGGLKSVVFGDDRTHSPNLVQTYFDTVVFRNEVLFRNFECREIVTAFLMGGQK